MARRSDYDPYRGNGRDDEYFYRPGNVGGGYTEPASGGYYDNGGYSDEGYQEEYYDEYYDDGYYEDTYDDYDDGYYEDYYEEPVSRKPTMASRAAGKANTELYGRPRSASRSQTRPQTQRVRQVSSYDYEDTYVPPKRRKRKKRHPFRNFMVFLMLLAAILAGIWFLGFRAPEQSSDGFHTRKEGLYNILICATDEEEMRTDTIMIATLDPDGGTVTLTSIPRDTIVDNGEAVPKLNGVYGLAGGGKAGAEALMDAVEKLVGFRPDGYAVIDYQIFKDVVDAMGGVRFDVPMDMVVDNANDPNDVLEIPAGEQLLDGTMALGVCRYRYGYLMADLQRQYVQQSFLKAMLKQMVSPEKLLKLPAVYTAAMDNVLTDLSGANIRYLALKVFLTGTDNITQQTLPGEAVYYNGADCYGLFGQSVLDMVNGSVNPYLEPLTLDDIYILTVSGGYLVESTWSGTAFDASQYVYE